MTNQELANRLFPEVTTTPAEMEARYPERHLPEGAKVTRIAPSPTGFMHLGNLYGAMVDERLAHQSGGIFYLRIEDTDRKRLVEDGVETILSVFKRFGLNFDEGATLEGDKGDYGPYTQSERGFIYKTYVKDMLAKGMAYPCFCTEEELAENHRLQEENKENFGYYGKYAIWRDRPAEDVEAALEAGKPWVIRFRSQGSIEHKIRFEDLCKGTMEITENDQDVVILKSDGLPTYHFAHVIDDHLMHTTHVVRGEEWLGTLPIHIQLFDALGFKRPKYVHTAQLMKLDGTSKRKLSKRKDPEFALDYYFSEGIPIDAAVEYVMTLLNSNFEEWRRANQTAPLDEFKFNTKKMSGSGALFDLDKLSDVCKNVVARMSAEQVYDLTTAWAEDYDTQLYGLMTRDAAYTKAILSIGRGGKKPRKDFGVWNEVKTYMGFFFDELFAPDYTQMPSHVDGETVAAVLKAYMDVYRNSEASDANSWYEEVKALCPQFGFTADMKAYKAEPGKYKGSVGDIAMILRVAVCGRAQAPDLFSCMELMGKERVLERLQAAVR
ncbi:MAG: glutamate--tRNA ligase [Lachnospiraceae bacterium]|nr:glutamate--tRNA ligase [Lachnospiraceae bacterium]